MKLTDFLQDVGRPVAYYPKLRKITGSATATILLCQFIYWRGKEKDEDGWLYKTSDEIEKETGLSYKEQKTARKKLVEAGLMEEHYARLDHVLRFKLNLDAINEKWGKDESDNGEQPIGTFGNDPKGCSLISTTETTTENTPDFFSLTESAIPKIEKQNAMIKRVKDITGWSLDTGGNGKGERALNKLIKLESSGVGDLELFWKWNTPDPLDKNDPRHFDRLRYGAFIKDQTLLAKWVEDRAGDYMQEQEEALPDLPHMRKFVPEEGNYVPNPYPRKR